MTREIKFEVERVKGNKLLGYETLNEDGAWVAVDVNGNKIGHGVFSVHHHGPLRKRQYIGRKDKNGTEIYDDDIVNQWWRSSFGKDGDKIIGVHKIVFDEQQLAYGSNAGGFWYYLAKMHMMNIEVIGNIYENPELLEKD